MTLTSNDSCVPDVDTQFLKDMVESFSYENIKDKTFYYGRIFIELFGIYFFWIVIHYVCAHMYASWCAPFTIVGFILSPFFVPAPHCQAFRWVIMNSSNTIVTMWVTMGTWFAKKIIL